MLGDKEAEIFRAVQIDFASEDPLIAECVRESSQSLLDESPDADIAGPFTEKASEILHGYGLYEKADAEEVLVSFFARLVKERTHEK